MRKLIRWLAKKAGVTTSYHVAAVYQQDSHVSTTTVSMTVTMRPWLHVDSYRDLVEFVRKESPRAATIPTITSITRLGA